MTTPGEPPLSPDEPTPPVTPTPPHHTAPTPATPTTPTPANLPPPSGPSYGTAPPPPPPSAPPSPAAPPPSSSTPPPPPPGGFPPPPTGQPYGGYPPQGQTPYGYPTPGQSPYGAPSPYGYGPPRAPRRRLATIITSAVIVAVAVGTAVAAGLNTSSDGSNLTAPTFNFTFSFPSFPSSFGNLGGKTDTLRNVSMTLPSGWKRVPISANKITGYLRQIGKENPKLAQLLSTQTGRESFKKIRYFAIEPKTASTGFVSNVNIITDTTTAPLDQTLAEKVQKSELHSDGAVDVKEHETRIGPQPAVEATYVLPLHGSGGKTQRVAGDQIFEIVPGGVVVATLSTLDRVRDLPAYRQMLRSLKTS